MTIGGFDWDDGNIEKCQKHGVSAEDIEDVFESHPSVFLNQKHGSSERRYHAVGKNKKGRHIFVVFTERRIERSVLIRPISARYMHKKEVDNYVRQKET